MIRCLYSCEGCGAKDRPVLVRERRPGEDLGVWMEALKHALSKDHSDKSLGCTSREMQEIKIPYVGGSVGSPPVN